MPELMMAQAISHRLQGGEVTATEPERTDGGLWSATVTHALPGKTSTYRAYWSYGAFGLVHIADQLTDSAHAG